MKSSRVVCRAYVLAFELHSGHWPSIDLPFFRFIMKSPHLLLDGTIQKIMKPPISGWFAHLRSKASSDIIFLVASKNFGLRCFCKAHYSFLILSMPGKTCKPEIKRNEAWQNWFFAWFNFGLPASKCNTLAFPRHISSHFTRVWKSLSLPLAIEGSSWFLALLLF